MNQKIIIFGGTFNPVHNGHIFMVETISKLLKPDKIIVIPANIPSHKKIMSDVSAKDRLEMCRLAFESNEKAEVSDIEIKRDGVSYTADTIVQLRSLHKLSWLYLTVGADMFMSFQSWKNPLKILNEASLCVIPRNDIAFNVLENQRENLKKMFNNAKIILVQSDCIHISSTQVRNAVLNNESIEDIVPKAVKDYIYLKNLYAKEM